MGASNFPVLFQLAFRQNSFMPIYEFHCQSCTHDSEVLIRNRSQKPRCPECGSTKMKKHLSVFAAGKAGAETPTSACSGNPGACGRCTN
jgi:putative FmdB family regulatory protein